MSILYFTPMKFLHFILLFTSFIFALAAPPGKSYATIPQSGGSDAKKNRYNGPTDAYTPYANTDSKREDWASSVRQEKSFGRDKSLGDVKANLSKLKKEY